MIRDLLPWAMRAQLWGDRKRWGLSIRPDDPCWTQWQQQTVRFYEANQRQGVGTHVNDAGYRMMSGIALAGLRVLEIGPGDLRHFDFWRERPAEFLAADVDTRMLDKAVHRLQQAGVVHRALHVQRHAPLPLETASVDMIISFYSLEHLYPLRPYLDEIHRVLKPGGQLVAALPAEGGLAWGLGRWLTSRRWLKRHTSIDPDKIICWEHPNFADELLRELDRCFEREATTLWPLPWLPWFDLNLVVRFVYRKGV